MSESRKPDAVQFECPRCGAGTLAETAGGVVTFKPPMCGWGHVPTEMEQVYLGADAYRKDAA